MMKKILALLLALLMLLSLAACGDSKSDDEEKDGKTSQSDEIENDEDEDDEKETKKNKKDKNKDKDKDKSEKKDDGKTATKLTAKKFATYDNEEAYYYFEDGGVYYEVDDKYGIMSLDGKKDTGAKFAYVDDEGMYFQVLKKVPGNTLEDLNSVTLMDGNGKDLIDETYASYEVLSERFVKVVEITKSVENKDEALLYYNEDGGISFGPSEGDALYGGNWYIYDLETGEKVPGASGTKPYSASAYGDILKITPDTGYSKYINADGEEIPEDNNAVFDNGTYSIIEDETGAVYDAYGEKIFSFSTDDYDDVRFVNGYYVGSKYDNGASTYFFLDENGKKIGREYDKTPYVYGNFVHAGDKVYNLDGEVIYEGADYIYVDEITLDYCMVHSEEEYVLIDREGNELGSVEKNSEEIDVNSSYLLAYTQKNEKDYYFCIEDGDFTIQGVAVYDFLVKKLEDDGTDKLYDVISGETLLEGYDYYSCSNINGEVYVFAENEDDTVDVFVISGK